MKKRNRTQRGPSPEPASLDEVIDELTVEKASEIERICAFQSALEEHLALPCPALVVGEPVSLIGFDYQGNLRRGLLAKCRRANGREYEVAASEVAIPSRTPGAIYFAAYRKWMGVDPYPSEPAAHAQGPHVEQPVLDLSGPVELAVLAVKQTTARCRILESGQIVTLRARVWKAIPGEIVVVNPKRQWHYAAGQYLSGVIESARLDVAALGLVPLKLSARGPWDPLEQYWGEDGEPIDEWARPIIARGLRKSFEMEQVLPGADPDDPFSDPISESNDRKDSGDTRGAYKILMDLCQADLRCLDAHAHLGNLIFDLPEEAIRHYEVGLRIGELSLGAGFDDVLPWGHIDNRPFFRCMHGFGLCLWRLGRFEDAGRVFNRMLWLNPSDNQGVRFLIDEVTAGIPWKDRSEK